MRRPFAIAASLAALASIATFAQELKLAPEGRGLLPKPAKMPATLSGTPPLHPFVSDPSGGFSRTIFETDENRHFRIIIRDFSFPPDRQPHTITLRSAVFLEFFGGPAEVKIARQPLALDVRPRTAVPAGAPIEVVNNGEQAVVVRALIVEAK